MSLSLLQYKDTISDLGQAAPLSRPLPRTPERLPVLPSTLLPASIRLWESLLPLLDVPPLASPPLPLSQPTRSAIALSPSMTSTKRRSWKSRTTMTTTRVSVVRTKRSRKVVFLFPNHCLRVKLTCLVQQSASVTGSLPSAPDAPKVFGDRSDSPLIADLGT